METTVVFDFHVSRAARDRYEFDQQLFSLTGNVVFANVRGAREFANRINSVRGTTHDPAKAVNGADLNAMGLIHEALHALLGLYRRRLDPRVIADALTWFESRAGRESVQATLLSFVENFPPLPVYRGEIKASEWLAGTSGDTPHRHIAMEELIMLWLDNANPAFEPLNELFSDKLLSGTSYRSIAAGLRDYFETRPRFGRNRQNFLDVLRAPALASPKSLAGQLAFLREAYGDDLGDILQQILLALDVLKEEELAIWALFHPHVPGGHQGGKWDMGDSSTAAVLSFLKEPEYERFSPDVDWMPSTVMMAKSVYVWLHQLSVAYKRSIQTLDQVPDEELNTLARRGFNALWLIGVWERSAASRRIKQLTGNPEAAASAYSLYGYSIADDLGGESSYQNLRDRAALRGIRLASDMVPNHMGIDSRWVIDHPDWFLSLPYSPYPAYSFNGPDLSSDGRVEIKVEDHYYDRTDAAVVFRRVDRWSGDTRYIYHGNDGTSFPWNDTAQLNYLNPQVREAVIQTIIHVARQFPIIRFDAAMTLTKQHFQRLWFPQPGTGGAIPSRAEHGMTKPDFDQAMPAEFWREVVDRIAVEVPGTLLLAEAFWLLEGYFVRTLGMHRVYNSAFMNMMRDEENANYRSVLKNTLEFDAEVLKRYVNFMNNPDERTAVDQFGKGDKYFGICTLLATLPGLPMFGHGQLEGFAERYGMEYRRSYHDEAPDNWLVGRHEREISPLLHRRPLFAEVSEFLLYDFFTDNGAVNEDVFAYSNRRDGERALVIYHNRYASTSGWVRMSCAYAEKFGDGNKCSRQRSLGEGLGLENDWNRLVAYRDSNTGLEYLHRSSELVEKGLRFELGAYQRHVFLDWRELRDEARYPWGALCDFLNGRGVPSLDDALRALELKPLHDAANAVFEPALIEALAPTIEAEPTEVVEPELVTDESAVAPKSENTASDPVAPLVNRAATFFAGVLEFQIREAERNRQSKQPAWTPAEATKRFEVQLTLAMRFASLEQPDAPWPGVADEVLPTARSKSQQWAEFVAWALLESVSHAAAPAEWEQYAVTLFDNARLRQLFGAVFEKFGAWGEDRWYAAARLRFAFAHAATTPGVPAPAKLATPPLSWVHDPEVAWLIGSNEHQGVRYFNRELFERLIWWMALRPLLEAAATEPIDFELAKDIVDDVAHRCEVAARSGYRVEALLEAGSTL
jgi:hypothetical protein